MTLFITISLFRTSVFWPLKKKHRNFCLIWFLEAFWYISPAWNLILFLTSHCTLWICFCFLLWLFVYFFGYFFNLFLCVYGQQYEQVLYLFDDNWHELVAIQHKQQEVRTLSDICWLWVTLSIENCHLSINMVFITKWLSRMSNGCCFRPQNPHQLILLYNLNI